MITTNSFTELRRDGRVITESMSTDQMLDAGWEPDKTIALRWVAGGESVELESKFGFLAQIVPNREYVAVLEDTDDSGDHSTLTAYRFDGVLVRSFRNLVEIAGSFEVGEFSWFEDPDPSLPTAFSVVFRVARTGATFVVDIDAASGSLSATREIR